MNHVYRVVFNHALKCVQVVSEFARGGHGAARIDHRAPRLAALATGLALACAMPSAVAGINGWNEFRGGIDHDWGKAGNWEFGEPTGNSVAAYIDGNRRAEVTAIGEQTNHIHVGNLGRGDLSIFGGGELTSAVIFIGTDATADGRVRIGGAGSNWTSLTTIGVGHLGQGLVDVENGATLHVGIDSYIGSGPGSSGVVNVIGTDSSFFTGNQLMVGHFGTGTVNVGDGATVQADFSRVGQHASGTGLLEVSGAGSTWTTTRDVHIGESGHGTARILQGGSASAGSGLYVGANHNSVGTLTIADAGSRFSAGAAQMVFGDLGTAVITVADGGQLSGGEAWMGNRIGGSGSVTVSGAGSHFESTLLKVGTNGIGSFVVYDGANATVTGSVDLAMTSTSRGTIRVGQDAILAVGGSTPAGIVAGAGQGLFELDGGTLRANSALTLDTNVSLASDSILDAHSDVLALRAFSGAGRLQKVGAAALTLADVDNSAWTGGMQVDAGSLWVGGSQAIGSGWLGMASGTTLGLSDGVALNNSVQLQGEVAITVAGGEHAALSGGISGGSSSTLVKREAGTLTLGGGTIGGLTRVEDGTLRVTGNALHGGNVEIGHAGTFEIDTTRVLNYAGQFSGSGTLRQGRHFLTLTGDSSSFTGTTVVDGGMLAVDGRLGGLVQMEHNALLAGNGRVGSVRMLSDSVLSPGSRLSGDIGRLSIDGDLSFDASATFQVDVAADGRSDHVAVAGQATLGNAGTIAVAAAGDWQASTRYTVLTANDGVDGRFAGVSSNFAFLDPTLAYDANNVYLTMARNDIRFEDFEPVPPVPTPSGPAFPQTSATMTRNQRSVAGAAEALGAGNAVYDAVVRLEAPQVVPAFDSLSGQVHAATRTTLLQNRFLQEGIEQRLDGGLGLAPVAGGSAWVAGGGRSGRVDGNGNGARARLNQHGLMVGGDWSLGEHTMLGVSAGTQRIDGHLDGLASRSRTDATEFGVYGASRWNRLSLRAGVTRAAYDVESDRRATVGSTLDQPLGARYDADATSVFARVGWDIDAGSVMLTPEVELAHVRLDTDAVGETGGSAALHVAADKDEYMTGTAALRAVWDISGGQSDRAMLTARLGWQYADGDLTTTSRAQFGDGTVFAIGAAPLARRMGIAQIGVALSPTDATRVSMQAVARAGGSQREVGAQLSWNWAF